MDDMDDINPTTARLALHDIEDRRRQIAEEVKIPAGYWWAVALGWIALGTISDTGNAIASVVATVVFGAIHSALAPRLLTGRHGSKHLSVRADVVGRHMAHLLLAGLVALVGVTILLAILADNDGAAHPATMASVVVAVAVLCGGPQLVSAIRRRTTIDSRH
jgi:mannitol-specific phosphotransferase system IIBC component